VFIYFGTDCPASLRENKITIFSAITCFVLLQLCWQCS